MEVIEIQCESDLEIKFGDVKVPEFLKYYICQPVLKILENSLARLFPCSEISIVGEVIFSYKRK